MEIVPCEQGSDEWHAARVGIPTASEFSAILTGSRGPAASAIRLTYMRKLAGERITGKPAESFAGAARRRGSAMEPEARRLYEFVNGVTVEQVGLIRNHGVGYSPDGLVGDRGLLEIKSMAPHILIEWWEAGVMPPEHHPQVQGGLWIAERDWLDFRGYWPGMKPLEVRIERDDEYIDRTLEPAVQIFRDELEAMVARLFFDAGPAVTLAPPVEDLATALPVY